MPESQKKKKSDNQTQVGNRSVDSLSHDHVSTPTASLSSPTLRWSGHHRFVDVVILQEIATDPYNSLEPLIDLLNDADTPLRGLEQALWHSLWVRHKEVRDSAQLFASRTSEIEK